MPPKSVYDCDSSYLDGQKMSLINTSMASQACVSNAPNSVATNSQKIGNAQLTIDPLIGIRLPIQGDRVTISGHAMLVSRLFGMEEEQYDGKIKTTTTNSEGRLCDYLIANDRKMLEEMYEYCTINGMDLAYVDTLATDLAGYRLSSLSIIVDGPIYDVGGHRLSFAWQEQDKEIVDRVLQSEKIQQTSIDQGFLQYEFKPGGGRNANFAFVEKMISVFSPAGDTENNSNDSFTVYTRIPISDRIYSARSKEVELVIPEPDYISSDGVGLWRTPELAEAANTSSRGLNANGVVSSLHLGSGLLTMLTGYARSKNIDITHLDELAALLKHNRPYQGI